MHLSARIFRYSDRIPQRQCWSCTVDHRLYPIRETVEKRASLPDLRHIFLCHAWDDRQTSAKAFYDLLVARGVSVWFSEADIKLGKPFIRAIDKGLAKSRVGIVLVTPSLLTRLPAAGEEPGTSAGIAFRWRYRHLLLGAVLFVVWHVGEMYLRCRVLNNRCPRE